MDTWRNGDENGTKREEDGMGRKHMDTGQIHETGGTETRRNTDIDETEYGYRRDGLQNEGKLLEEDKSVT